MCVSLAVLIIVAQSSRGKKRVSLQTILTGSGVQPASNGTGTAAKAAEA